MNTTIIENCFAVQKIGIVSHCRCWAVLPVERFGSNSKVHVHVWVSIYSLQRDMCGVTFNLWWKTVQRQSFSLFKWNLSSEFLTFQAFMYEFKDQSLSVFLSSHALRQMKKGSIHGSSREAGCDSILKIARLTTHFAHTHSLPRQLHICPLLTFRGTDSPSV